MITSNLSKKTSIYDRLFLSENLAVNSILLERERETRTHLTSLLYNSINNKKIQKNNTSVFFIKIPYRESNITLPVGNFIFNTSHLNY